jgi:D-alanine-D-alanine ligase
MSNNKTNVCVIFGGRSGEHDVSLMSAKFVLSILSPEKYNVSQLGITREGIWLTGENTLDKFNNNKFDELEPVTIHPFPNSEGLYSIKTGELLTPIDIIFPVLHGTFGEDGTLQGLLELAEFAYVGPGVTGSAVGMDKAIFFDVMRANDLPMVDTLLVTRKEFASTTEKTLDKVEKYFGTYPLFVKPANLGSSVGISKIQNRSDLYEGLMEAVAYDRRVIVQKGLNVREIEVSVLGNENPQASICGEIRPEADFYSYEAKYHDERSTAIIPAIIAEKLALEIRELAVKAYKACDLAGLARVDFFIDTDTEKIYLNELNTLPGFTSISMYPMLWEASGLSNIKLADKLIELAFARKEERQVTERTFRRIEN